MKNVNRLPKSMSTASLSQKVDAIITHFGIGVPASKKSKQQRVANLKAIILLKHKNRKA